MNAVLEAKRGIFDIFMNITFTVSTYTCVSHMKNEIKFIVYFLFVW